MAANVGTMTIPLYAKVGGKEVHLGDVEVDLRVTSTRQVGRALLAAIELHERCQ